MDEIHEDRKRWLSCPEAAALLGVSHRTVRAMVKSGEIPSINPVQPRISRAWLEDFLRRHSIAQPVEPVAS